MKTLIILLLIGNQAFSDDWFCQHESGKREGDTIWACGIGEAISEGDARHNALKDAQREFSEICEMSNDCMGKKLNVDPQRTTCSPHNGHMKCYRLLVINLKP
jgi:hypothetical protein